MNGIIKALLSINALFFLASASMADDSITINWDNDGAKTINRQSPTCIGASCSSPIGISSNATGVITGNITSNSVLMVYRYTTFSGGDTVGCRATLRVSKSGASCTVDSDDMLASDGGLGNIPDCTGSGAATVGPTCDVNWNVGMDY